MAAAQFYERCQWMQERQAIIFFGVFPIFESGGITKHLMTGPSGNSEFVSLGPVIKCLLFAAIIALWTLAAFLSFSHTSEAETHARRKLYHFNPYVAKAKQS